MIKASAVCRAAGEAGKKVNTEANRHILLDNLPRTSLLGDIKRALRPEKLVGVEDVHLELFRFTPTRRAYISVSHPDFQRQALLKLDKFSVGGLPVSARACTVPRIIGALRGIKGRKAGIPRCSGLIASGAMGNGRQVCMWGLPPKISVENVKRFLEKNNIDTWGEKPEVYYIDLPPDTFSLYSRFMIRTPSVSNSYHLARRIHMTYFRPDIYGAKFQVRACVVP